jgi:acyl-CoA reductase-like NAD-dependent aldehyde dehydrogenase
VNNSRFGLQRGVFTERFAHVKQAHAELEVGGVIINGTPGFRIDSMPYGGHQGQRPGARRREIRHGGDERTAVVGVLSDPGDRRTDIP